MKIALIRHGESEANKNSIIQGHMDFLLTERGKQQAKEIADYLLKKSMPFQKIYSSDLSRAKETTEIIAEKLKIKDIKFDARLREFNLGIFQGRYNYEMTEEEKKFIQSCWADHSIHIPNGENHIEMKTRIKSIFDEIVQENNENSNILIVGHGGSLYHILQSILQIFPETDEWFENCKFNEISRASEKDNWKLTYFNNKEM
ncbi:MAG: histidine phosphatase family protein [Candidatus Heimdallarchaeota archaeon]|nr:histidine phosphatase family protein [Candidatus Heimdallarchaeota archaeon]